MIQAVQNNFHRVQNYTFGKNRDKILPEIAKETTEMPLATIKISKTIKTNKITKFFGNLVKEIKKKKLFYSLTLLGLAAGIQNGVVCIQRSTHDKNEKAIYKQVSLPDYQKIKYNDSLIQHNGFNPYYTSYYRDIIDSINGKPLNINEKYKVDKLRQKAVTQNTYQNALKKAIYQKDSITCAFNHQKDSVENALNHQLDSASNAFDKNIKQLQIAVKKASRRLR